ncbi:MAG: methyltransferase domain-containing protein, partial [Thermoplasmata archaeon]|nr:methyltransferase domain-containing protein [Thermoplasmata archaeon]
MTPEMLSKTRENARKGGYRNVEFRLGEIEHLPVADGSVDVVISNCVINLAPEKGPVYREAYRVLREGGRFAVSDVVATRPIRAADRANPALWSACSSGALEVKKVKSLLREAGFDKVEIELARGTDTPSSLKDQASLGVVSASIRATKTGG